MIRSARALVLPLVALVACGEGGPGAGEGGDGPGATAVCERGSPESTIAWAYPSPTGFDLHDVWVAPSGKAWAVGESGTVLHHNGQDWEPPESISSDTLQAIWGTSETDIWASGRYNNAYHFNGEHWGQVGGPLEAGMFTGTAPDDVWWVAAGQAAHYDGETWGEPIDLGDESVELAWAAAPDDVWAVGLTGYFHYDGDAWSRAQPSGANQWAAIDGSAGDNIWVTGIMGYPARYDGTAWAQVGDGLFGDSDDSTDLWVAGPDDVWVAGRTTIVHYQGPEQGTVAELGEQGVGYLRGIDGHGESVFAVGSNGNLVHKQGDSWVLDSTPRLPARPEDIDGVGNEAWAVGSDAVIHYTAGTFEVIQLERSSLEGVFARAADDVWAVGRGVYHYDGAAWTEQPIAINELPLYAVWAGGPDDVWAVGDQGTVLHYDGEWELVPYPGVDPLRVIAGTDHGDIVVAGEDSLMHWQRGEWTDLVDPMDDELAGSIEDAIGDGDRIYLADGHGSVLRWTRSGLSTYLDCTAADIAPHRLSLDADKTMWIANDEQISRVRDDRLEVLYSTPLEVNGLFHAQDGMLIATSVLGIFGELVP